jgi:hypothetical protein
VEVCASAAPDARRSQAVSVAPTPACKDPQERTHIVHASIAVNPAFSPLPDLSLSFYVTHKYTNIDQGKRSKQIGECSLEGHTANLGFTRKLIQNSNNWVTDAFNRKPHKL